MSSPTTLYPGDGYDALDAGGRVAGSYTIDQLNSAYQQMQEPMHPQVDAAHSDPTDMEDFEARVKRMQTAERAYHGALPEPFKTKGQEQNLNLQDNRLKPIVNTGASLLFGQSLRFVMVDAKTTDPNGSNGDLLADIWSANRQAIFLNKLAISGGKYGHVFIKLIDGGIIKDGETYPRMVLLDARQMDVELDPDDGDLVRAYNYYWLSYIQGPDGKPKQALRRQRFERSDLDQYNTSGEPVPLGGPESWRIYNQYTTNQTSRLTVNGPAVRNWLDMTPPVDWPYSWCPVHDAQNLPETARYFGAEDITPDLIRLQSELNFCLSNIKAIEYYLGHPLLWGRGFSSAQMSRSPDNVIIIESETGELNAIPMTPDIQSHMNMADDIRHDMDEISGIPAMLTGRLKDFPRGDLPGVTLKMAYQSAINKTVNKRELYGDMLCLLSSHMLEMAGAGEGLDVDIIWQDILPANDKEWAVTAPVAVSMGMSHKTALAGIGVNYDTELEQRVQEQQQEEDAGLSAPPAIAAPAMDANGNVLNPDASGTDTAPLTDTTNNDTLASGDNTASAPAQSPASRSALNHPAMVRARTNAVASGARMRASAKSPKQATAKTPATAKASARSSKSKG